MHFYSYHILILPNISPKPAFQDLTVTVASEFPYSEVEVIEDWESRHMVNKQSFVDEQEWHLYAHTECMRRELMIDQFDPNARRSAISVKCRAARRPGYFIWNIFMVTVRLGGGVFRVGVEKGGGGG